VKKEFGIEEEEDKGVCENGGFVGKFRP